MTEPDPVADIARAAAATLDPSLSTEVEAELQHEDGVPRAYADPVSIAGLIVAIASLAWNVYTQLRRHPHQALAGAVRQRWEQDHTLDETAARVIDVVAAETVKHGAD